MHVDPIRVQLQWSSSMHSVHTCVHMIVVVLMGGGGAQIWVVFAIIGGGGRHSVYINKLITAIIK